MKVLELCANYPGPNEKSALSYVKARNQNYRKSGIYDIMVINFSLREGWYEEDGIKVISFAEYKANYSDDVFDLLISHAPNIRNHYRFLKKFQSKFKNLVFVFHGHEILSIKKEYPKPYPYLRGRNVFRYISPIYDYLKFHLWHDYFMKQGNNVHMVFVSKWIYNKFEEYIGLDVKNLKAYNYIISNNISERFEHEHYDMTVPKEYDFISIRSNLDDPKYAVDVVNNLAWANPKYRFLLVGRGNFFKHYSKAPNIEQIERYISPEEMVTLFNKSRCGLMPTKNDTQGIMACEMATFGMPLITSDINVCKVVFEGFPNVTYIPNNDNHIDLSQIINEIKPLEKIIDKYYKVNTINKEIELLKSIASDG